MVTAYTIECLLNAGISSAEDRNRFWWDTAVDDSGYFRTSLPIESVQSWFLKHNVLLEDLCCLCEVEGGELFDCGQPGYVDTILRSLDSGTDEGFVDWDGRSVYAAIE